MYKSARECPEIVPKFVHFPDKRKVVESWAVTHDLYCLVLRSQGPSEP
jgi:hypothetical protein